MIKLKDLLKEGGWGGPSGASSAGQGHLTAPSTSSSTAIGGAPAGTVRIPGVNIDTKKKKKKKKKHTLDIEETINEKKINPKKDPEHIFQHVIRVGTKIHYGLGAVYQVMKLYPGGFSVRMRSAGRSGNMFNPKFNLEKDNFISQAKMGLIKGIEA